MFDWITVVLSRPLAPLFAVTVPIVRGDCDRVLCAAIVRFAVTAAPSSGTSLERVVP